jgi:zinc D-Ala-D-Ala carboxypeptidase
MPDFGKHFQQHEFDSPDQPGSGAKMQQAFLDKLNLARDIAGIPFKINSGIRTKERNAKEGGKPDSSHLTGWAADIDVPNTGGARPRFKIIQALIMAGFNRLGIANGFIHADCDPTKDKDCIWTY